MQTDHKLRGVLVWLCLAILLLGAPTSASVSALLPPLALVFFGLVAIFAIAPSTRVILYAEPVRAASASRAPPAAA